MFVQLSCSAPKVLEMAQTVLHAESRIEAKIEALQLLELMLINCGGVQSKFFFELLKK